MGFLDWLFARKETNCSKWIKKVEYLNSENQTLSQYNMELKSQVAELGKRVDDTSWGLWVEKENQWNDRHPKVDIQHTQRTVKRKNGTVSVGVDLKLFVEPRDYHVQKWCDDLRLKPSHFDSIGALALALYKLDRVDFSYVYDSVQHGINEMWLFPYELEALKKGDCEDYAHRLASRLIAAGVPRFRVRVVCGHTWTGIGHSTVYVLDDDLQTWRHFNSTSPLDWFNPAFKKKLSKVENLSEMPMSNDPTDVLGLGIKSVWFSFNNQFSWHKFDSKTSARTFDHEKKKGLKYVEIE